jgi:Uma2 family endonuclease
VVDGIRVSAVPVEQRIPMSWDEYAALDHDQVRGEYVDGELVVSPLPALPHQRIVNRLWALLDMRCPPGVWVTTNWGWKPGADEFGPDVMVFDQTEETVRYTGVPHLVVEVPSSDRGTDLVHKFRKYAAAGAPRYWVVDPEGPEITVFELDQLGGYLSRGSYGPDETADLDFGPGTLSLRPRDLLA